MSRPPSKIRILFLSTHEWSDLWRRRQRLAHELALRPEVASVLYVNPPVISSVLDVLRRRFAPSHLGDSRRAHLDAIRGRPRQVADRVWTYTGSQKTLPLTKNEAIRRLKPLNAFNAATYVGRMRACLNRLPGDQLMVYLSHPLHTFALGAFKSRVLSCYDWTDDWTQFELIPLADRDEYTRLSERLPSQVDVVFAVSRDLVQRARQMNSNVYWMPNATSLPSMMDNPHTPDAELESIRPPRLGYVGQIGDRIDFALLRKIAEARPDWSMVMIGPVWSNRIAEAEGLGRLPNVHFAGLRPYASLPGVVGQLDVCMIPHTLDALTVSMDPIKLYDYLATGKPIVTTLVAGVDRFADAIYIADSHDAFIAQIGAALVEKGDTLSDRRRAYGRDNSWSARAGQVWQALQEVLDQPPRTNDAREGKSHGPVGFPTARTRLGSDP